MLRVNQMHVLCHEYHRVILGTDFPLPYSKSDFWQKRMRHEYVFHLQSMKISTFLRVVLCAFIISRRLRGTCCLPLQGRKNNAREEKCWTVTDWLQFGGTENTDYNLTWVRERIIPTERPPLVEVSANVFGWMMPRCQHHGSLQPYSRYSRLERLLLHSSSSSILFMSLSAPRSRPTNSQKIW
jgi:hypothetical protein